MVSVGRVGSVAEIKKGIKIWNFHRKLEILVGIWKILLKTRFFLKYAFFFFFARNYWVWLDLAKSH